ncbi:two pore domain potassium channel family protein [Flagellimonas alvinocaridis]|uniref:Two pore domain potassium channel family protein n=1 Tax=Flagellimonas alvinocaridis TaxID=2530200 RepID=A0A4S8RGA2_9FLAO|nr:ion channel [Allomuricauda alvinocaridis]THV57338.1 two pore domain potassium channel family protein [Allomuricauda alvinocaridis]
MQNPLTFIKKSTYTIRFELFFFSLIAVLFGSLLVPNPYFVDYILPVLLLINLASGVLLVIKKRNILFFFLLLFIVGIGFYVFRVNTDFSSGSQIQLGRLGLYALFYATVTVEIIKQVWFAKRVNKTVIIGLMTGYLSLGLLAFFIFMTIEMTAPNSFEGLLMASNSIEDKMDALMYYSYITLLTIGYGEIIPVTPIAQKAAILTGLMGQFYIVIITAVVVEKYVSHSKNI